MLGRTISCHYCGFEVVPRAKKYDLLPRFVVSKWCPSAKTYDLLSLFVVSKWCQC